MNSRNSKVKHNYESDRAKCCKKFLGKMNEITF